MSAFVVAIDGPAGAGKSTVAKRVAEALRFAFVDTGALYRCVALAALNAGVEASDDAALGQLAEGLDITFSNDGSSHRVIVDGADVTDAIRRPEVSALASQCSAQPAVRAALLEQQRRLGQRPPGAVLEGRDIGTVVFPAAPLKVFLTASSAARAKRRAGDLASSGEPVDLVALEQAINERDARDSTRTHAPLRCADDAARLETDDLTIDEVVACIVDWAHDRGAK
jgi:cytidylate kinase